MRGAERQEEMRRYIHFANRVSVSELSKRWNITEETVRRDLDKLEGQGSVTRVHGGAVWSGGVDRSGVRFFTRQLHNGAAKRDIAIKASDLIRAKKTVIADSSTTVLEALRALGDCPDLTVVSNAVGITDRGAEVPFHLISTGGLFNHDSMSFQGEPAIRTLERYHVELAVLSCKALDLDRGVMDSYESEAVVKRVMVRRADEVAILADHTKFDQVAFLKLMDLEGLSYIITDTKPSDEWVDRCEELAIALVY